MVNISKRNDGEKRFAEYFLQSDDRIDSLTLGMLVNNNIEGINPVTPVKIGSDRVFKYDITNLVTLKEYFGESVKKEKLLKAFYGISVSMKLATDYMINWTSFVLDEDNIYVDKDAEKTRIICLPLLQVINDGNTCNFFKNVLFTVQLDEEENNDYVGKLLTILNPKTYTIDKFICELEDMMGIEHRVFETYNEEEEDEEVLEETAKESKADEKAEEDKTEAAKVEEKAEEVKTEAAKVEEKAEEVKTEAAKVEEKAEKVKTEAAKVEEKAEEVKTETAKVEEKAEEVKTEAAKVEEKAEEVKTETAKVEEKAEEVKTEVAKVEEKAEEVKTETVKVNKFEMKFKDDATDDQATKADNNSETTGKPEQEADKNFPFLYSQKRDEKVFIKKERFVIGSDKESSDYCIKGNPKVEPNHAFIIKKENEYYLSDNDTREGTVLDHLSLFPEDDELLRNGMQIEIAGEILEFRVHD